MVTQYLFSFVRHSLFFACVISQIFATEKAISSDATDATAATAAAAPICTLPKDKDAFKTWLHRFFVRSDYLTKKDALFYAELSIKVNVYNHAVLELKPGCSRAELETWVDGFKARSSVGFARVQPYRPILKPFEHHTNESPAEIDGFTSWLEALLTETDLLQKTFADRSFLPAQRRDLAEQVRPTLVPGCTISDVQDRLSAMFFKQKRMYFEAALKKAIPAVKDHTELKAFFERSEWDSLLPRSVRDKMVERANNVARDVNFIQTALLPFVDGFKSSDPVAEKMGVPFYFRQKLYDQLKANINARLSNFYLEQVNYYNELYDKTFPLGSLRGVLSDVALASVTEDDDLVFTVQNVLACSQVLCFNGPHTLDKDSFEIMRSDVFQAILNYFDATYFAPAGKTLEKYFRETAVVERPKLKEVADKTGIASFIRLVRKPFIAATV